MKPDLARLDDARTLFDSQMFEQAFQDMRSRILALGVNPDLPDLDLAIACIVRENLCAQFAQALYESGLGEPSDSEQIMGIQRVPREQRAIAQLNRAIAQATKHREIAAA